ncbi:MAG: histidinol-phosphatase [Lachnospiraceae bacterium]|nr:histidinol-phosphatase [Lachnospiraceae bacterium]
MFANYHSHTARCHHATGTQREYVEKAIESGYRIFGFSDHTPYPYNNGFVSSIRMLPGELESYVQETLDLKAEYKKDIDIRLGLEVEYFPKHFEDLLRLCEPYPIEYFLLAQHHTDNEYDGTYVGFPTKDEVVLQKYCNQIYEGLATGKFLYLAHPDLVNFVGDDAVYERYMRELCRKIKSYGLPLEINFLGIWDHRNYPDRRFWKIAGQEQVDVIFGADAHHVSKIWLPECEKVAMQIVEENGLHLLTQMDI